MDYIKLLEEKGFEDSSIAKIQAFAVTHNKYFEKVDIYKSLKDVFISFEYAGCSNAVIEQILINNIKILLKSTRDILKIAYVWGNAGVLNTMNKDGGIRIAHTNRTYLRTLYLEKNMKRTTAPISYNSLIMWDDEFMQDYSGVMANSKVQFYPSYENLLNLFVTIGSTKEEKEMILDKIIFNKALAWLSNIKKKEKENASQRKNRSI